MWSIAAARLLLPPDVHVQAPPNLSDDLAPLLAAGIDDWGGVSPVTADHVNPERAWPALERAGAAPPRRRATPSPRGSPSTRPSPSPPNAGSTRAVRFPVLDATDAEGLARDARVVLGGRGGPPPLVGGTSRAPRVGARRERACQRGPRRDRPRPAGGRGRAAHACSRPGAPRCGQVAEVADDLRPRPWATRSRSSSTATSTTRTSAPSSASSAPSRRVRSRSTCAARRTCSTSRRSAAGWPRPRSGVRPRSACRGASTRSFDGDYYLDVLGAVRAGLRAHPHPRLHRAGGDRRARGARACPSPSTSCD